MNSTTPFQPTGLANAELHFSDRALTRSRSITRQIPWWTFITVIILSATLLPAIFLSIDANDWVEVAEGLLISLGLRAIANLSRLVIIRMFNVINVSRRGFVVRGRNFFIEDNPLEQFMAERYFVHDAHDRKVRERKDQMASYPIVWTVLIICCLLVRIAPDLLGASLISQNISVRVPHQREIIAPDLGAPNRTGLALRGNCVWNRGGDKKQDDTFGYVIYQYCIDVLINSTEIDKPARTLNGTLGNDDIHVVFHIEAITEDIFAEDWEPFTDRDKAQQVLDDILANGTKLTCHTETCRRDYRTQPDILTYLLLMEVGITPRTLVGDDDALEKLKNQSKGKVAQRLKPVTRASFIVLVVAVNLFLLLSSISSKDESTRISLYRAMAEIQQLSDGPNVSCDDDFSGECFVTAIAMDPPSNMNRYWSVNNDVPCYLVMNTKTSVEDEQRDSQMRFEVVRDEERSPIEIVMGKKKMVKIRADCAHFGYTGEPSTVENLPPGQVGKKAIKDKQKMV